MSLMSLPSRRNRWRSAIVAVAVAVSSFTIAACGDEPAEDGGVVEEEPLEEEEAD